MLATERQNKLEKLNILSPIKLHRRHLKSKHKFSKICGVHNFKN